MQKSSFGTKCLLFDQRFVISKRLWCNFTNFFFRKYIFYFIFIDQEPILNKEMKHLCQSPAKNATFKTRIWHPQNWIVTEQCHGESVIIPTGKISELSFFCYFE